MAAPPLILMIGIVAAIALLLLALAAATTHRRSALFAGARPPTGVPTPKASLPLLGNALEVVRNRHRLHDWLLDKTLELGAKPPATTTTTADDHDAAPIRPTPGLSLAPRSWAFTTPLNPLYLVISSPAALEHVLSSKGMETYVKGPEFSARIGDLLGKGIFNADGDAWRWQRKLAAHLFSAVRFRDFVASAFSLSVEHLFDALEPYAAAADDAAAAAAAADGPSSSSQPQPPPAVDLHALMYDLTLDTFARVGFGVELGMLEGAADEAPRAGGGGCGVGGNSGNSGGAGAARAINGVTGREFAHAFDEAQRLVNRRFWLPLWGLCERLTGDAARVRRDVRLVRRFAEGIVRQRRALLAKEASLGGGGSSADNADARPDLLTLFMRPGALASSTAARFDGADGNGNTNNGNTTTNANELTDGEVVDAVLNFIIASRDTTAQATSWAFYELLRHPDVEAKLLAEADAVLGPLAEEEEDEGEESSKSSAGGSKKNKHPSYDELRSLRYARAVFLEVCRMHPSIPQDCKYAVRDDWLPDGTPVPKGSLLLYSPYVVCRLPSFWGEDAGEFRPERWLKEPSEGGAGAGAGGVGAAAAAPLGGGGGGAANAGAGAGGFLAPSPYAFPAFNAGPRLCLGRGFAELEGAYALVETLRRYRFRPAPGEGEGEGGGQGGEGFVTKTYEQSTSLPILGGLRVHVTRRRRGAAQQAAAA